MICLNIVLTKERKIKNKQRIHEWTWKRWISNSIRNFILTLPCCFALKYFHLNVIWNWFAKRLPQTQNQANCRHFVIYGQHKKKIKICFQKSGSGDVQAKISSSNCHNILFKVDYSHVSAACTCRINKINRFPRFMLCDNNNP